MMQGLGILLLLSISLELGEGIFLCLVFQIVSIWAFFLIVFCTIMVLFVVFLLSIGLQCVSIVFWIKNGDRLEIGVSPINSNIMNW